MKKLLQEVDLFPKFDDSVRRKTDTGGVLAILAFVSMIALYIIRYREWVNTVPEQKFVINTPDIPLTKDGIIDPNEFPKFNISFDILMQHIPCPYLQVNVFDNIKEVDVNFESKIKMERFDQSGKRIMEKYYPKNQSTPEDGYCGSCYGMKSGCCNTCKEVRSAFKARMKPLPPIATIDQCTREGYIEMLKTMANESCRAYGTLSVHQYPGVFEIGPGGMEKPEGLNLTHTINKLTLGSKSTFAPLNGHKEIQKREGKMKMHYFIRAVSIGNNGYSFGASRYQNYRGNMSQKFPGIFFKYEISPIGVVDGVKPTFAHFISELISIMGGVFAIATFLDSLLIKLTPEPALPAAFR